VPRMMVVALLLLFSNQGTSQRFAGTWLADHAGTTYVRLVLRGADDALAGTLSLGNVQVDDRGDVKTVTAAKSAGPVFDVHVNGAVLSFARKDGDDTDHFEVRLTSADNAELTLLVSEADRQAAGVSSLTPFQLTRSR
jgi:hypothetical protein